VTGAECGLGADEVHLSTLDRVQRSRLRSREQIQRAVGRARLQRGHRRRQRAPGASSRIGGQIARAPEERRRRRKATPHLGAPRRPLELGGHVLVRSCCGQGLVPRAAIGVGVRIAHVRESFVHALSAAE
jgi:hypothetical protein